MVILLIAKGLVAFLVLYLLFFLVGAAWEGISKGDASPKEVALIALLTEVALIILVGLLYGAYLILTL